MESQTYRTSTKLAPAPHFLKPPRVSRALPRSSTSLPLRYQKKHAESVRGRGTLSHWSAKGGRLEAEHPLEIGDWVELEVKRHRGYVRDRKGIALPSSRTPPNGAIRPRHSVSRWARSLRWS